MVNFNFIDETIVTTLNFGIGIPETPTIDFDFTELLGSPNYDFEFGEGVSIYNTLKGVSNNFNSIWCDSNSGLTKGKFYITTNDSVMVVNLTSNSVEDYYTNSVAGRSEDILKSDDMIDITVAR